MNLNSIQFLVFLVVVVAVHFFLAQRFRALFLTLSSFLFIGLYNPESLIALLVFSGFTFYIAKNVADNLMLYLTGLVLNAYAIIMFNYFTWSPLGFDFSYTFISFNVSSFIIALGLSFYSLQNIAYLTEVHFKRMPAEQDLLKFSLYNSFFPRALSGPVMLPKEFIPQIGNNTVTSEKLVSGFNRFLFGLFKKMVIADRLSPAVHSIFDFGDVNNGLTTVIGIYLFTIQLYFDFSGYSDMALGAAKMLGFDLKENFNLPLRSGSISDFWRRWHISLIQWFTLYIYYPVVYRLRQYKKTAVLVGILATFLISGIWHGIGLNFFIWACCHALYLSVELFTKSWRLGERMTGFFGKLLLSFVVFNLVCFSNIFFRSGSFETAVQLIKNAVSDFMPDDCLRDLIAPLAVGGHQIDEFNLYISLLITALFLVFEKRLNVLANKEKLNVVFVSVLIILLFVFGIFSNGERFIYMQF